MEGFAVTRFSGRATKVACALLMTLALCAGALAAEKNGGEKHWFKGDIHCHSTWSDGNSMPESVVNWYKSRGYQFFALTDHNTFQAGEKWVAVAPKKGKGQVMQAAYDRYKEKFGAQAEERTSGSQTLVRLKSFDELSRQFNEPGKFLLIPGEEITTQGPKGTPYRVHVVTMNIAKPIATPVPKAGQKNVGSWLANTMGRQIDRQRKATGRLIHGHLNHPLWSHMTMEDVLAVQGLNQMEINNESPSDMVKLEPIWDAVIAERINKRKPLMLGLAVDDAHNHLTNDSLPEDSAAKGWIVVRAESLTADNVVKAIDAGDFYASSGPALLDLKQEKTQLALKIKPEDGLTYKTEFIGMRKGGRPGEVLASADGLDPVYPVKGDELYVRAKVVSSKAVKNRKGELAYYATVWTQPYQPQKMK